MLKNAASQKIGAQMVTASDGSAFTGSVTVSVTGDAGTQGTGSVGSGACTHEGNGYHTYAPAQAETNYDLIAFTFTGSGAIPATVQIETRIDANVTHWLGTAAATPATAGIPDINVKNINNLATTSVTAVNANVGTTQPVNFTGTGTNAMVETHVAGTGRTYYVAPQAFGTMTLSSPSATFTIAQKPGGTATGTEGNGTKTIVVVQGSSEGTAYNTGTDVLTVTINISGGHNTVAALLTVINAGTHFTAGGATNTGSTISTSTTGSGTLAGGIASSSSGPGTLAAPYDSLGNAYTAASPGDTILAMAGTFFDTAVFESGGPVPILTVTKNNITIQGVSQVDTIFKCFGYDAGLQVNAKRCIVRDVNIVAVYGGSSNINMTGDDGLIEHCDLSGPETPIVITGARCVARYCKSAGGRYGIKAAGDSFLIEQCQATTDSTFTYTANSNFAGIYINGAGGTVIGGSSNANCTTASSTGSLMGISLCQFKTDFHDHRISVVNVAGTLGGVYGIANLNNTSGNQASVGYFHGGGFESMLNLQGSYTEIEASSVSGSDIRLNGFKTDPTKWNNQSNIHKAVEGTDTRYGIANDSSGRVDIGKVLGTASAGTAGYMGPDWGHVNAPTTTVGLTGTTIATSQVVASVTGLTASDVAAIKAKTDNLPASPAAVGSAMTLTSAYDAAKTAITPTTALTHGGTALDALEAALAQGYGKWVINSSAKTLTLYAPNNTTALKVFDIGPNLTAPLTRTPQ